MVVYGKNIPLCIYRWVQSGCTTSRLGFLLRPHHEGRSPTDCSESRFHVSPGKIYPENSEISGHEQLGNIH